MVNLGCVFCCFVLKWGFVIFGLWNIGVVLVWFCRVCCCGKKLLSIPESAKLLAGESNTDRTEVIPAKKMFLNTSNQRVPSVRPSITSLLSQMKLL